MIKKALTYLTILAITALPVQLISANVDNLTMQMSMQKSLNQSAMTTDECLHGMNKQLVEAATSLNENPCCDNQSHDCQGCNNFSYTSGAMLLFPYAANKPSSLKTLKILTSHLALTGIPQKNLLRPPRIII